MPPSAGPASVLTPRSQRVRSVRALGRRSARERAGLFLAEGPQSVREALAAGPDAVVDLFHDEQGAQRHPELVAAAREQGVAVRPTSAEGIAAMADTGRPQGLVAVCRPVDRGLAEALGDRPRLVVVLAHVRDPGNAGTVIRCADAVGADAVVVCDASVDIYNPKVVRSTAGSLWHLPISRGCPVPQVIETCRRRGLRLLAADGSGATCLPEADLSVPHAWVLGNEAWGLEGRVRDACDEVVSIPIHGRAESLNLAMAATVCLYASATAQRAGGAA